jgi:saccharopine dehydrogenase (NAD+, L-lysine-forming)
MEDTGAWVNLPQDDNTLIVGLKELALDTFPIVNKHTYFAHVFKGQEGWQVGGCAVCKSWSAGGEGLLQ